MHRSLINTAKDARFCYRISRGVQNSAAELTENLCPKDRRLTAKRALVLGLVHAICKGIHSAKEGARHVARCVGSLHPQAVMAARGASAG